MKLEMGAVGVTDDGGRDPGAWRAESLCRKQPTRWWFAPSAHEATRAKAICSSCAVRQPCLEFALSRPDLLGVWASTTPNERAELRRTRRAPETPSVAIDLPAEEAADTRDDATVRAARTIAPAAGPTPAVPTNTVPPSKDGTPKKTRATNSALPDARARDRKLVAPPAGANRAPQFPPGSVRVEPDELLTPAEAARKLGVTPNTVTRWSRDGKIPAIQTMGGHRRFRRSEIERLLGAHAAGGTLSVNR